MRFRIATLSIAFVLLNTPWAEAQFAGSFSNPAPHKTQFSTLDEKPSLQPLKLAPALGLNVDDAKTLTILPTVHALDEIRVTEWLHIQFRLDINPKPPAGDVATVAANIKSTTGTGNAEIAPRVSWFPTAVNSGGKRNVGIEARLAASGAVQLGDTTMPGTSDIDSSAFGVFSGQATLALWLRSVYVTGTGKYFYSTGSTILSDEVNKTWAIDSSLVIPFASQDMDGKTTEYFVQLRMTKDDSHEVYGITLATSFEPF